MEKILTSLLGKKTTVQDIYKFEQQFAKVVEQSRSEILYGFKILDAGESEF